MSSQYEPFETSAQQINFYEEQPPSIPKPVTQPQNPQVKITTLLLGTCKAQERLIRTLTVKLKDQEKTLLTLEQKIIALGEMIESHQKRSVMDRKQIAEDIGILLNKRDVRLQNDKDRRRRKKESIQTKINTAKNKLTS
jgi:hypothetical protein